MENIVANDIPKASYASGTDLNSLMYKMGGRYWVAVSLPYSVIGNLVTTTQVKSKSSAISSEIVNRFVDSKHVRELKQYILDNKDNFIIPPITLVSKTELPFKPVTFGNETIKSDEIYKTIDAVGSLMGKVTIPLGYSFTCLDGNHRTKAIAELAVQHPDSIQENNMLCNIVYEEDNFRIRQDFVDINQNAKITTATINTLFNSRDPLARLTSNTIEGNEYLDNNVELLGASISKNSPKLYTLNNIKNAIVELSNNNSQSRTSINKLSKDLKENPELAGVLSLDVDVFFDVLKENEIIKDFLNNNDKINIRANGLITSGVGLIILARVVAMASETIKGMSYKDIIKRVISFDWSRDNEFWNGKILSENKTIISSVNSVKATAESLFKHIF